MTPEHPFDVLDLTVALDYGQFYLIGLPLQHGGSEMLTRLVETAIKGARIAASEQNEGVVVLSPHQNNFAMSLRVERWPAEPPDDLDAWQEAFLTGLVVGDGGLAYESPTVAWETILIPPGRYTARITGPGFINRDWPGSTRPGDTWRLQLWPARTNPGALPALPVGAGMTMKPSPPPVVVRVPSVSAGILHVCDLSRGEPGESVEAARRSAEPLCGRCAGAGHQHQTPVVQCSTWR